MKPLVVIAIGGNSLITDSEHMSVVDQYRAAGETASHIAPIVAAGNRVVVTHGNGPQVGFILMRSELTRDVLHQVPLANCVADTQGSIGMQIAQSLQNAFRRLGSEQQVVAVVTQVLVDPEDPSFTNPTKPIGPFLSEAEARQRAETDGWKIARDANRGWRRVVPSPAPLEILEMPVIRALVENDTIVVAAGGGGIPVIQKPDGSLRPRPAVIDKDAASCDRMTAAECRRYLDEGHFAMGSMRPKIEAALAFLDAGGEEVIVTQPHHLGEAMQGRQGTHIVP